MSSTRRSASLSASESPPTVFRCDYPDAALGEWAVFWEVADEESFEAAAGQPDDPREVIEGETWLAISVGAVVDIENFQ